MMMLLGRAALRACEGRASERPIRSVDCGRKEEKEMGGSLSVKGETMKGAGLEEEGVRGRKPWHWVNEDAEWRM